MVVVVIGLCTFSKPWWLLWWPLYLHQTVVAIVMASVLSPNRVGCCDGLCTFTKPWWLLWLPLYLHQEYSPGCFYLDRCHMFDLYCGTYRVGLCVGAPVIPGFLWSSLQVHTRRDILNQSILLHPLSCNKTGQCYLSFCVSRLSVHSSIFYSVSYWLTGKYSENVTLLYKFYRQSKGRWESSMRHWVCWVCT
jgi:hypothetical protein